jgi:hypothetical protein
MERVRAAREHPMGAKWRPVRLPDSARGFLGRQRRSARTHHAHAAQLPIVSTVLLCAAR